MSTNYEGTWREGMTKKAIEAVEAKFKSAESHEGQARKSEMRACRELAVAYRTYLKGDKKRFTEAAAELFSKGASTAYEYVQAASAERTFGAAVKATGATVEDIGYRTWAKLDRFSGSAEKIEDGKAVLDLEVVRSKRPSKAGETVPGLMTNAGLALTLGEFAGTNNSPKEDRRVNRIEKFLRDLVREECNRFKGELQANGERAAFEYAVRLGIAWTVANGSATDLALTSIMREWKVEDEVVAQERVLIRAKAAERMAARQAAKVEAEAATAAATAPKPPAEVKDVTATAKKRGGATKASTKK